MFDDSEFSWKMNIYLVLEREQELECVQEIKRELQVIRSPSLILEQLRFRLDDGAKRNRGKKKFHEYERGYEILRERLHQLDRQIEEIQESKQTLYNEFEEIQRESNNYLYILPISLSDQLQLRRLKRKLYNLKDEFEQKLQELDCQRQEILLRVSYLDYLLVWLLVLYAVHAEDAHEGGGFRNLILDGWWLEFWEIILLAAGDVERNPGPRQITDEELAKVSDTPIGK